ncbi:hypothetical protein [Nitratireductor sp. ZSWI3]|uniref:hypothetical protein n=1 Tax=Nitratireductor sp. ZSWI3 TaxID=2966359 RepID=UPI00215051D9|nr:hypothetical protein [Nitratireductor sp. ZSWI3]MCR4268931.1 hypothetical protein [Nitratireductor sp. ZSWI3]
MEDCYGYISYGEDELYHLGALFSALRLIHFSPGVKITVLTDKPFVFDRYPINTLELTETQKTAMSFDNRYHFGIKAAGTIELLKHCDRLLFMDTDMYPVGDLSNCFNRISPSHSLMGVCKGRPKGDYEKLRGRHIAVGTQELTGTEPMWTSGILGVHKMNTNALTDAYAALEEVSAIVTTHTPEQFCVGVALSQGGRTICPHRLPIRHYSTSGKKRFARSRIVAFFTEHGHKGIDCQIELARRVRLWRSPADLLMQALRGKVTP